MNSIGINKGDASMRLVVGVALSRMNCRIHAILGGLVARDELDAQVFMRDHFEIIHIRG